MADTDPDTSAPTPVSVQLTSVSTAQDEARRFVPIRLITSDGATFEWFALLPDFNASAPRMFANIKLNDSLKSSGC